MAPSIIENIAPFSQFLFPHSVLHPVHVTLQDQQHGLGSLVYTIQDSYYNGNIRPFVKHHNVSSPLFDVRETDTAFFLEGEFPGIMAKEDILIEKLGPRTLLVETKQEHYDLQKGWEEYSVKTEASNCLDSNAVNSKPKKHEKEHRERKYDDNAGEGTVKSILSERHVGTLQRSFTFPTTVDILGVKARLRHGLLVMMVPKGRDEEVGLKRITIED